MIKARLALGILALGALIVLIAGLQGTVFRGGKPLPEGPSYSQGAGSEAFPELPLGWFLALIRVFFFAGFVLVVLAFFFRDLRRHLVRLLIAMGVLFLAWYMVQRLPKGEWNPRAAQPAPSAPPGAEGLARGAEGEIRLPTWSIYVGTVALGTLLAFWLFPKIGRARRVRRAQAIGAVAREARLELEQGAPVSDVVLRCWLRMVEILGQRSGNPDKPHLTPREFAQALESLGFRDEAIALLTRLFEEVRYGHKDSESRRELALSALSALEKAYG